MIPEVRGGKSFGTAGMGRQVSADVEVPIVRTSKPVVTVVERHQKKEAMRQVTPEAAVEAAVKAVVDAMIEYGPDGHADGAEEITRAALDAAAPHMLAEAARTFDAVDNSDVVAIIEEVDAAWSWDTSPDIYAAYAVALADAGYRKVGRAHG